MAVFTRAPSVSIVIKDGGTLNVVRGDQHIHYHVDGAEIITPKSAPVRIAGVGIAAFSGAPEVTITAEAVDPDDG